MRSILILSLLLGLLVGCHDDEPAKMPPTSSQAQPQPVANSQSSSRDKTLPIQGYATIRGAVTYKSKEPPRVNMVKPMKHHEVLPAEIPERGWYVNDQMRIRDVAFFVKPPKGYPMPASPQADKAPTRADGSPIASVLQTANDGLYSPRILIAHPIQKMEWKNAQPFDCCVSAQSERGNLNLSIGRGKSTGPRDVGHDDSGPYRIACGVNHWTWGYFFRMSHPFCVATNTNGEFKLSHVPVLAPPHRLTLYLWHEMINNGKPKPLRELDLEPGKELTLDLTLPD